MDELGIRLWTTSTIRGCRSLSTAHPQPRRPRRGSCAQVGGVYPPAGVDERQHHIRHTGPSAHMFIHRLARVLPRPGGRFRSFSTAASPRPAPGALSTDFLGRFRPVLSRTTREPVTRQRLAPPCWQGVARAQARAGGMVLLVPREDPPPVLTSSTTRRSELR